jgi:cold-inducible RNA-binding protein
MGKKLYVGNLPFSVTETALIDSFSAYGTVESAHLITDRDTGRAKGFGFIEMSSDEEARVAIEGMNGKELEGRALTVNEARPKASGGPNSYGGGGGQRSGGYGGGGNRGSAMRGY